MLESTRYPSLGKYAATHSFSAMNAKKVPLKNVACNRQKKQWKEKDAPTLKRVA
jgi:hypothetical protein